MSFQWALPIETSAAMKNNFHALSRFAAINCGIVYVYCLNFQKIDEDEYGGIWELLKEGFITSFACFSVTWIVFFTGLHFDDVNTPLSSLWKSYSTHASVVCYLTIAINKFTTRTHHFSDANSKLNRCVDLFQWNGTKPTKRNRCNILS